MREGEVDNGREQTAGAKEREREGENAKSREELKEKEEERDRWRERSVAMERIHVAFRDNSVVLPTM